MYTLSYPWLDARDTREVTCCVCAGAHEQTKRFGFTLNAAPFEIRECGTDGIMYLHPQPGEEYCHQLYNHPSYFQGTDDMYGLNLLDEKKAVAIARIRIQEIRTHAPLAESLLEIGSGYGHVLAEARREGFKTVCGVEFSEAAVARGAEAGIEMIYLDAEAPLWNDIEGSYDVVASYSSLEHLRSPVLFLRAVKKRINPGGIFVLRVPETDLQGPRLSLLDHFWHFTRSGMEALARREGFLVCDILESGVFHGIQHPAQMKNMTFILSPQ